MTGEAPIVLDSAVHKALREMAQAIWDEHKVQLIDVHFSWIETVGGATASPFTIDAHTRSR